MSIPGLRGASRAFRTLAPRWRGARRPMSSLMSDGQQKLLAAHLQDADPDVFGIVEREKKRQKHFINLIPSENFTSQAVLDALGSPMQNKYSEGYPGARYYGGNQLIDEAERLCQKRALETFGLDPAQWGVNVQALSGSPANLYVYSALLNTHDRLMGLDLPHGGHLSHGYQTPSKKISLVSKYFETIPYRLDEATGLIDYDALDKLARIFHPKIIIAGASAYSRLIDYKAMKATADAVGAYLMSDMAHIAGLVAARVIPSPFEHSDIVTTTSHKSLRGPRGAIIFFRRGVRRTNSKGVPEHYDLESRINASVFPGHQGGPHNHTITALAVALKQAQDPSFRAYQTAVLANARALAARLQDLGYALVSGGTDNHLVLVDLARSKPGGGGEGSSTSAGAGVDGARAERLLELVGVAANKNTVPGDKSALVPHGLRMGTPAMTTRGFSERDFERVAEIVDRAVKVAIKVDAAARSWAESENAKGGDEAGEKLKPGSLKTFNRYLDEHAETNEEIVRLRSEVADWVGTYPVPWAET